MQESRHTRPRAVNATGALNSLGKTLDVFRIWIDGLKNRSITGQELVKTTKIRAASETGMDARSRFPSLNILRALFGWSWPTILWHSRPRIPNDLKTSHKRVASTCADAIAYHRQKCIAASQHLVCIANSHRTEKELVFHFTLTSNK